MTPQQERKQERNGFLISAGIHAVLLLIVFFVVAFKPTDPVIEGMGGEGVNFGFDTEGMGDVNSLDPASFNEPQPETVENTEASEAVTPSEQDFTSVNNNDLAETVVPDKQQTETTTPTKQTQTKQVQTVTQPSTNKQNSYTNPGDGNGNKTGNQGDVKGDINLKNQYGGKPGNGGGGGEGDGNGTSLDLNGWHWLKRPKVDDASNETGKIVFKIKVDEDGNLVSVVPIEKQVSDAVVKKYEEAIWKIEFEKNRDNSSIQPFSSGSITFIIRKN